MAQILSCTYIATHNYEPKVTQIQHSIAMTLLHVASPHAILQYLGLSQICWHNLKHNRMVCYASIMLAFWGSILK